MSPEELVVPTKGRGRKKGFSPYKSKPGSLNSSILETSLQILNVDYVDYKPLGVRRIAYLHKDRYKLISDKKQFDAVGDVLTLARRAQIIPFEDISDGRTQTDGPPVYDHPEQLSTALAAVVDMAQFHRMLKQPYRVEVLCEVAAQVIHTAELVGRWGIQTYSGSGSNPMAANHECPLRVVYAWRERQQRTVVLHIGDHDPSGLRNIFHPFVEDVRAYLDYYGVPKSAFIVDRILITPLQIEEHIPEDSRRAPTASQLADGWPWPFCAEAEALPPDVTDDIITASVAVYLDEDILARAIRRDKRERLKAARDVVSKLQRKKPRQR